MKSPKKIHITLSLDTRVVASQEEKKMDLLVHFWGFNCSLKQSREPINRYFDIEG